jgi:hypothetical protein
MPVREHFAAGGKILALCAENAHASFANSAECPPLNVIIMRQQLNVEQSRAISETMAKCGGGLVETCFSSRSGTKAEISICRAAH